MNTVTLRIELLSAATFGRGDGVAGLVDAEVEHTEDGLPFLRGRTLKGLLVEAAEDLVFAVERQNAGAPDEEKERRCWVKESKRRLFGVEGSGTDSGGLLHVGNAQLPEGLRRILSDAVRNESEKLTAADVLATLTGIRRQTAMSESGAPRDDSLRSMRVVLRDVVLDAELTFLREPPDEETEEKDLALLAGAALGLRAAGTGRNRGRGRLRAQLFVGGEDRTRHYFDALARGI
jgi:RAMP superfamily